MPMNVKDAIAKIETGRCLKMSDSLKNEVNAKLADKINIGDTVEIIKTGSTGIVTKKIKYNRDSQNYFSPNGYTAIQVDIGTRKNNYSGSSLRVINKIER